MEIMKRLLAVLLMLTAIDSVLASFRQHFSRHHQGTSTASLLVREVQVILKS